MGNNINTQPKGMTSQEFKELNKQARIGKINTSNDGTLMKIIGYNNTLDIIVEFQDEFHYQVHASYKAFQLGIVKNPGKRVINGIGYIGVGPY